MSQQIIVGEVAGAFGVKGWIKIYSDTDPIHNILDYRPWLLMSLDGTKEYNVLSGRVHGNFVIAQLEGLNDRDEAQKLKSSKVLVPRDRFPSLESGQYYWADLIGLQVANVDGVELGSVVKMMSTGANDVIVVNAERERLIPFVKGRFVKEINLEEGRMLVDWDADF